MRTISYCLLLIAALCTTQDLVAQNNTSRVFGDRLIACVHNDSGYTRYNYNNQMQLAGIVRNNNGTFTTTYIDYTPGFINDEHYDLQITEHEADCATTHYVQLGSNGFACMCHSLFRDIDGSASLHTLTFEYNDDDRLVMITEECPFYIETTILNYEGDDIVSTTTVEEDSDDFDVYYNTDIQVSSTPNTGRLMMFDAFGVYTEQLPMLYYAGLLGYATGHLPTSSIDTDIFGVDTYEYQWDTDGDGYQIEYDSYEGGVASDLMSIEWFRPAMDLATATDTQIAEIYNMNGIRTERSAQGVNIYRMDDGSTVKAAITR